MSNKINLGLFVSPNAQDNITVAGAQQMIECLAAYGMPYDTVSVLQGTNSAGPEDEISFSQLVAARTNPENEYFVIGRYKADADQKAYTLNKDKMGMYIPQEDGTPAKPKDGLNSFIVLYMDRHPGATVAEAESAAYSIPSVLQAVKNELAAIRSMVTA